MTRGPRAATLAALLLAGAAVDARAEIAPPAVMPARLLRTLAHRPDGYDPSAGVPVATDLLLGDLLFHSPHVLGARARELGLSCHTCHPNGATHPSLLLPGAVDPKRPGRVDLSTAHFRAGADNGRDDPLDIPSLRGVRYTAPYGRDGRVASLAEFTAGVVSGEFGGAGLSPAYLAALVRYLHELDFLPNRELDARGRLAPARIEPRRNDAEPAASKPIAPAVSDAARRGERIFAAPQQGFGGASCATCHPPSSYFRDGRVHRLGSAPSASPYGLEDGYDTTTLLGTAESAPYFHDGSLATLADVVAWFDERFGLGLTPGERADLVAYLEAVGAVDARRDERALGQRLVETFAYLALLDGGEARDDRQVWQAALLLCERALTSPDVPGAVAARVTAARDRLARLRAAVAADRPLAALRRDLPPLQRELTRLAADWTGALPKSR